MTTVCHTFMDTHILQHPNVIRLLLSQSAYPEIDVAIHWDEPKKPHKLIISCVHLAYDCVS